jgi:hypothetical protein
VTRPSCIWPVIAAGLITVSAFGQPVGAAFTYQGQLKQADAPVTGSYAMDFRIYDAASGGTQIGAAQSWTVSVDEGLFTVPLDFGSGVFDGSRRWLEVTVEGASLAPRQELTATPYAVNAQNTAVAQSVAAVPWSAITGVPDNVSNACGWLSVRRLRPADACAGGGGEGAARAGQRGARVGGSASGCAGVPLLSRRQRPGPHAGRH